MYFHQALRDGSLWFMLACLAVFVGVVIGLYTEVGSGISYHAYTRPGSGELASDLPPEAIGRAELEPQLLRRRPAAGRTRGRDDR